MSTILRKATQDDLPTLLEFEQGVIKAERPFNPMLIDEHFHYYDIAALMQGEDSTVLVVEKEGELVASGYALIKEDRAYFRNDKMGYLGFMFVPEEHRGNGYNRVLIQGLFDWCASRGVTEIKLDVYADNEAAIRAYEKVGFKKHLVQMRVDIS